MWYISINGVNKYIFQGFLYNCYSRNICMYWKNFLNKCLNKDSKLNGMQFYILIKLFKKFYVIFMKDLILSYLFI